MKKTPTRLLIAFHDLGLGGIQKKIVDISWHLNQNNPDIPVRISLRRKIGLFLEQIPPTTHISAPFRPIYRFGTLRFFLWMVKEVLIFKPTHILTFMDFSSIPTITATKVFFWRKIKVTIGEDILTSKYLTDLFGPKAPLRQRLIEKYYPLASKILVQTPVQKSDLEKILKTPNNPQIISTPNWLPLDYPPKKPVLKRDIDILYVGRIAAQKNLTDFIKIIHDLSTSIPKLRVFIVGTGEEDEKINKLIIKYHLQKIITKIPQTTEPQQYYLRAKTFLLTSDYEGFPLTLMEAIASGCRPVCRDLPEIKLFFGKDPQDYLFHNIPQAVNLLKSTPPKTLNQYQEKLVKIQQKNIRKYINYCIN